MDHWVCVTRSVQRFAGGRTERELIRRRAILKLALSPAMNRERRKRVRVSCVDRANMWRLRRAAWLAVSAASGDTVGGCCCMCGYEVPLHHRSQGICFPLPEARNHLSKEHNTDQNVYICE